MGKAATLWRASRPGYFKARTSTTIRTTQDGRYRATQDGRLRLISPTIFVPKESTAWGDGTITPVTIPTVISLTDNVLDILLTQDGQPILI
jgi:hypothetical protein